MPEVFAGIPYQESRYRGKVTSFACAEGWWQFIPEAAKQANIGQSRRPILYPMLYLPRHHPMLYLPRRPPPQCSAGPTRLVWSRLVPPGPTWSRLVWFRLVGFPPALIELPLPAEPD